MLLLRMMFQWEEQLRSKAEKVTDVNNFGEVVGVYWPNGDIVFTTRANTGTTATPGPPS